MNCSECNKWLLPPKRGKAGHTCSDACRQKRCRRLASYKKNSVRDVTSKKMKGVDHDQGRTGNTEG